MNIISWFLGGTKTKKVRRSIDSYSYRRGGKTVKVSKHKRSVTVSASPRQQAKKPSGARPAPVAANPRWLKLNDIIEVNLGGSKWHLMYVDEVKPTADRRGEYAYCRCYNETVLTTMIFRGDTHYRFIDE